MHRTGVRTPSCSLVWAFSLFVCSLPFVVRSTRLPPGDDVSGFRGDGRSEEVSTRAVGRSLLGARCSDGPCTLAAGASHTCVIDWEGGVHCWGQGLYGQLGYEDIAAVGGDPGDMPPQVVNVGVPAKNIAAGLAHTCVLTDQNRVRCWGWGSRGRLGYNSGVSRGDANLTMPPPDVDLGTEGEVVQIEAGSSHNCAVFDDGRLKCWGTNELGQLGYGHTRDIGDSPGEMPPPDVDVGGSVAQVACGGAFTCALLTDGSVKCWGDTRFGQTGDSAFGGTFVIVEETRQSTDMIGDEPGEMPPATVVLDGEVWQISAGSYHTCVIMEANRQVKCFGDNRYGQLGYGNTQNIGGYLPNDLPPPDVPIGYSGDYESQVDFVKGDGGGRTFIVDSEYNASEVVQVLASHDKTCAVVVDGFVTCWGSGAEFQLGNGHNVVNIADNEGEMPSRMVQTGARTVHVSAGAYHVCVLVLSFEFYSPTVPLEHTSVRCWGNSAYGQTGYETKLQIGIKCDDPYVTYNANDGENCSPLPTADVNLNSSHVLYAAPPPPCPPPAPPLSDSVFVREWTQSSSIEIESNGNPLLGFGVQDFGLTQESNDEAYGVAADVSNNVYVTGVIFLEPTYSSTAAASPTNQSNVTGNATFSPTMTPTAAPTAPPTAASESAEEERMFVQKLNAGGTILWTITSKDSRAAYASAVTVVSETELDPDIFVVGAFKGTHISFADKTLTPTSDARVTRGMIAKISAFGSVIWLKTLEGEGGGSRILPSAVTADPATGDVIFGGQFNTANMTINDVVLQNHNEAAPYATQPATDVFLVRMASSGSLIWANSHGGEKSETLYSVTLGDADSIYITGTFQSADLAFQEAPEDICSWEWLSTRVLRPLCTREDREAARFESVTAEDGNGLVSVYRWDQDIYIAKMTSDGQNEWAIRAGGKDEDASRGIAYDPVESVVYTAGRYEEELFIGTHALDYALKSVGRDDVFVWKTSVTGTTMWMVGGGGILSDSAEGITVDRDGDVYIAGNFVKAATFGEHYLLTKQGKSSDTDIFVAKIWKTGSFDYALGVGGTGIDYANGIKVTGPAAGGHSLFVAGEFGYSRYQPSGESTFGRYEDTYLDSKGVFTTTTLTTTLATTMSSDAKWH
ncbi:hypothetical protein CYMTET_48927 [Cymbomonas tetramitiformis]|uniref:Uncharacterized protein n=1 Tax=Cymbomonas tetramitiformis TaxID=36881 RepID=A0AAE0BSC3_9CHLO|nr:hypothetical protein CYMTET_48927 [Cymbomonas tetramitiformis]